jgi:hypothetical protein
MAAPKGGALESVDSVALLAMSPRVLQGERRTPGEYAHLPAVARLSDLDSPYDTHRQERH